MLQQPLVAEPGTRVVYISPNTLLIAYVIEALSGEKYSEYIRRQVLLPLGITTFDENSTEDAPVLGYIDAVGHKPGSLARTTESNESPSGGWWASPKDLARLLMGLREFEVLSEEVTRRELGAVSGSVLEVGGVPGSYKSCFAISGGIVAVLFINSEKADPLALMTEALPTTTFPIRLNPPPGPNSGAWSFFAPAGATYSVERTDGIAAGDWSLLKVVKGDNSAIELPPHDAFHAAEFLRVRRN